MPGTVTVPSTLSGHAAEIWRKAFLSAYDGTCSERDDKDECAAKIAWSAVKKGYKKNDKDQWVAKAGDPVIGPISTNVDNQPPLAYDKDTLKPGAGTKMQRWKAAYNKALAEDCRQSDNPTECARAYANKAIGRVETDVEPVEKVKVNGRSVKRIIERGGAGSGHHGHEGRPGEKGGSLPSGASGGRKPKRGEKGYNQPGSGTGHYERGEGYIGPDKPAKTGKESSARAKKAGLKPGESMPESNTLKGDERKKWVKAVAETNTLDQLREKQGTASERYGKMIAQEASDQELEEQQAYIDFLTDVVGYQNFPDLREGSFDPLQVLHGRTEGATYPLFRIKGGAGSGHHGHRGRVGEVGGSEPGTGGGSRAKRKLREDTDDSDLDRGYDRAEQEYGPFGDPYEPVIDWMSVPDVGEKGKEVKYQREDPLGYDKENPPEPTTFPFEPSEYEKEMDGRRRHKFITKEIEKQLPALYSQENNPDPTVYAKWFHPYATQEWYATEYDPNEGMFFGWVNSGQDSELGYFSRQELAEVNVRGIPIERDLYFRPARLSEVKESARRQISQEEYGFRLGSVLRGEEKTMDEHPLKTRIKKDVMDAYEKRSEVRERLNDVDYALIERMGDQEIIRPDRFSTITWRTMPPSQKNVRSEATRRIIERNYAQAVEDAQINGWRAKINHYAPEEYYFVKPHDTDIGRVIMRAVLVRNEDSVDWELKTLSQFATESIAVQLPKGILRHNKEQLLKIPVIRGGPGSGHHGHRGRVGEVGGSEPGSGGSSSRPSAEMSDWAEMVAAENEEKRIAASLQADVESASSEELEAAGTIYDQLAGKPAAKAPVAERLPELSLSEIAREIRKDWSKQGKGVNYAAKPYLEAMASLESISDNYMFDSGESVVAYFLGNATTWKGDTARAVKKELNKRLKAAR